MIMPSQVAVKKIVVAVCDPLQPLTKDSMMVDLKVFILAIFIENPAKIIEENI